MTVVIPDRDAAFYADRMESRSLACACSAQRSLADLVSEDARAATVFEQFGLDYCCQGCRSVEEAAADRGAPIAEVLAALAALGAPPSENTRPIAQADLDELTHHIVARHHRYVREACPTIGGWLKKLVTRHGDRHPELDEVRKTFVDLQDELLGHMVKEENVLFPFIDDLARANRNGQRPMRGPFGTILNPVRVMESDHALAGELMARLRVLTNGYEPPPDACATYRVCYLELARFERDLHAHVHLENNILFPRAVELESSLA
jgi:regulator of cell morphogenesis and NO signaling